MQSKISGWGGWRTTAALVSQKGDVRAKISSKLLKKTAFKDNKNKLTVFEQKDIENVDYNSVTKSLDQIISKLTSK